MPVLRAPESPWFSFLNELRRQLPVVQKKRYMTPDGETTPLVSTQQLEMIEQWRRWSYFKLRYKEIS